MYIFYMLHKQALLNFLHYGALSLFPYISWNVCTITSTWSFLLSEFQKLSVLLCFVCLFGVDFFFLFFFFNLDFAISTLM